MLIEEQSTIRTEISAGGMPARPVSGLAFLLGILFVMGMFPTAFGPSLAAQDVPLFEREPFFEVVLDDANDNAVLEVRRASFPNGKVPDRLPRAGSLKFELVDRPGLLYEVRWPSVADVLSFEEILLRKALEHVEQGQFSKAHDYYLVLLERFPSAEGLNPAVRNFLYRYAGAEFQNDKYEDALVLLMALHEQDAAFRGLMPALSKVTDRLIQNRLEQDDFAGAQALMDSFEKQFPDLPQQTFVSWREELDSSVNDRLQQAAALLGDEQYAAARRSALAALAIRPDDKNAIELLQTIDQQRPGVVVGVFQSLPQRLTNRIDDETAHRLLPLLSYPLVNMVDFQAEGGVYESTLGKLTHAVDGRRTTIAVDQEYWNPHSPAAPFRVTESLMLQARESGGPLAALLQGVLSTDGMGIEIFWQQVHVRPEALLANTYLGIDWNKSLTVQPEPEVSGPFLITNRSPQEWVLQRHSSEGENQGTIKEITERLFSSERDACEALIAGEIDAIARLTPLGAAQLRNQSAVQLTKYVIPTVHCLVLSNSRSIMRVPELRRALVYALDRDRLLESGFSAGSESAELQVVSGPFSAGTGFSDPIGYGYDRLVEAYAYEPRLAATLVSVAAASQGESGGATPELPRLRLAHPPSPAARSLCQLIQQQWEVVGLSVDLIESADPQMDASEWDIRYTEVNVEEPVVDAYRIFGPNGIVGTQSSRMGLALRELNYAATWTAVRENLHDIHRIVHQELEMIPLFQAAHYRANCTSLQGLPTRPVRFYQGWRDWVRTTEGVAR